MTLNRLASRGFDRSAISHEESPGDFIVNVGCSCCEALVINGTPTHERGCPNAVHECSGCNELIPLRQRYCSDCQ